MNMNMKVFIKNFGYSIFANLISLLISVILVIVLPKVITIEAYGYWQLYLFYVAYIGFFHLGWSDGVYLRIGGKNYDNLDRKNMNTQFWYLTIFQFLIMIFISFLIVFFVKDENKICIFLFTISNCLFMVPKAFLIYILQAVNRIKEYSIVTIIEKILFCVLIVLSLLLGFREFKILILSDIISKIISTGLCVFYCRDIFKSGFTKISIGIKEALLNISIGSKLMIANIAGMLILGVVRMGIESQWSIETFGKVSLTLSVSNLMMVFINAIGIVIFPMLRRTSEERLGKMYAIMRTLLMTTLFVGILIYYPLKPILSGWLPQYGESLKYMALMFPVCIFEGKISLLINTYLKALRKEKEMLYANSISFIAACFLTFFCVFLMKNLNLTVAIISFLFALRCIISELYVAKALQMNFNKDIILEMLMVFIFMISSWFFEPAHGFIVYLITLTVYLLIKKQEIAYTLINLKEFTNNSRS